jgi:uncharacterized membrane protein SpoIIM required for sporulation
MKQEAFEARHAAEWREFEDWLDGRKRTRDVSGRTPDASVAAEVPQRYRRVCQHLALARDRGYGADIVDRLHRMAVGGYHALYAERIPSRGALLAFVSSKFPAMVRSERRTLAVAALLFFGPLAGMIALLQYFPDLVYYFIAPERLAGIEKMYDPRAERLGRTPEADSAFYMFGVYIWNNIRIAFQTFAGGLLFGLGTLFFLLFNGFFIGAVAGHLTQAGYAVTFWSFVAGHSALELTGIVLSGAAGLKLGMALIAPGRLTRTQALVAAARDSAGLIYGAAGMLLVAAFVEAFWSPLTEFAPFVKYCVGIAGWVGVAAYFALAGSARGS